MTNLSWPALLVFLSTAAFSPVARADDAHPRRARAMSLSATEPAVLVGADRAWVPDTGRGDPLSICAGERCRPVLAIERCDVPRCPGAGRLVIARDRIADVSDYPTDRDGFHRERDAIAADPELAGLAGWLGYVPETPRTPPPRWSHRDEELHWELSVGVGAAYLAHTDVGTGIVTAAGGVRFLVDWGSDDDEAFFGVLFGSSVGADLRVTVIPNLRGQTADEFAVAIGLAPALGMTPDGEPFRLPSVYGVLIPEFGIALRGDMEPAFYAQWSAAAAFLLDEHVGLEARASFMLIDDWVPGDAVEGIVGISLAVLAR